MPQAYLNTPLGEITLTEEDGALVSLDWGRGAVLETTPLLDSAKEQLRAYFAGQRTRFELPLNPAGTPFQRQLWQALRSIPYGKTQSYGELAAQVGTSARAIGGACGRNPLPILIPCHRVLAADGGLGGYSAEGGVEAKRWLLRLEERSYRQSALPHAQR